MNLVKVKQLIETLQKQDPEALVAISESEEGEYFSIWEDECSLSEVLLLPESGQDEYFTEEDFLHENIIEGIGGEEVSREDLVKAIVLWPNH